MEPGDRSDNATKRGPGPISSSDWPARTADAIETTVNALHDRVIRPLVLVGRGIVFGIVVASSALVLGVLMSVALVRLLDVYAFPKRVWASEALVGALLAAIGLLAWSFRRSRHSPERG